MRAAPFIALLFVVTVFAGCVADTSSGGKNSVGRLGAARKVPTIQIPVGWSENALVTGHDHSDHALHAQMSTPNFRIVGYDPLITDYYGSTAGGHLCGDAKESKQGRRLAVVHSFSTDVAFVISDVTDAANPKKIGELVMEMTHVYDLAVTPDLKYVLLATSPLGPVLGATDPRKSPIPPIYTAKFHDACSGEVRPVQGPEAGLPYGAGVILVDISNPRNPSVADFRQFPVLGGHSVQVAEVNGKTLILSTVANLPGPANYYVFMDIMQTPLGGKLNILNVFQYRAANPQDEVASAAWTAHDAFIQKHPITGQWLAYLAYGNWGLVVLDIGNVQSPKVLSHIVPWAFVPKVGANFAAGYIHEAIPINGTWDGHHYTFLGDECGGHPQTVPTCLAYAIDTTDPTNPKLVGAWTLPHDVAWTGGLMFSLHYLGVHNRTLFATVYHGGLWAIDVSHLPDKPKSLESVGVFMPPNQSPKPPPKGGYSPRVNDIVVFDDGNMVVFDAQTGLYMVRFDDSNPAPAPPPWDLGFKAS
jgi:hypothetical protein